MTLRVLDLFSGIGGFSLGLERAGMQTIVFCECDPYCRRVLAKHWPGVPIYDDVRTLTAARLAADGIIEVVADASNGLRREKSGSVGNREGGEGGEGGETQGGGVWQRNWRAWNDGPATRGVDLICGGFPCQDISVAGKGAGIDGARSGLWAEYARIIGEVRPRYVLIENVAALLGRGLVRVLWDLAARGYDTEWSCIRASDVGAPHRRDRVWIVAYPKSDLRGTFWDEIADTFDRTSPTMADAFGMRKLQPERGERAQRRRTSNFSWWQSEPDVGRVVDGLSTYMDRIGGIPIEPTIQSDKKRSSAGRVHRLRSLGNAVVPQIVELIGRAIVEADAPELREAAE